MTVIHQSLPQSEAQIETAIKAGSPLEAASAMRAWVEGNPIDGNAYRLAFRALSVAADSGAHEEIAANEDMQALIRILLLQPLFDDLPRVLHHDLAALLTSGNGNAARRIVLVILPVLARLLEQESDIALTLFLLVARSVMPSTHPLNKQISALHLANFTKFTKPDLSLPYSVKFNARQFGANRDDLVARYRNRASIFENADLGFAHFLVLDRLRPEGLFEPNQEPTLAQILERRAAETKQERAAARVLILRYARTDPTLDQALLTKWGFEDDLLGAARALPKLSSDFGNASSQLAHKRWQKAAYAGFNKARLAIPPLQRLGTKPRVALCVSGQLRGFRAAFASWKRSLLPFADFDIYVHTWSSIGRADPQPFRAFLPFAGVRFCSEWKRIGTLLGYEEMRARYPTLIEALASTARIDAPALEALYDARQVVADDERDARFAKLSNQEKMHYKIWAAHNLAVNSGKTYDLILRLRPDLELKLPGFSWDRLARNCSQAPVIYAESPYGLHYESLMIGDQMAIGAPQAMDIYASTFEVYQAIASRGLDGFPKELTGHVSLAQTCWLAGIDVQALPFKRGGLLEAEALDAQVVYSSVGADADGRSDIHDRALIDACKADWGAG